MNAAHFHLVVNHLPIVFPIVGIIVLLVGFVSKSEPIKRTAYLIFTLGGVFTILAMVSGDGAEEVVENIDGISHNYIETHEETAETFALLSYLLAATGLVALWASFTKKSFSNFVSMLVTILAFITLYFAKQTGTTGGEIRHTEIRGNAVQHQDAPLEEGDDD